MNPQNLNKRITQRVHENMNFLDNWLDFEPFFLVLISKKKILLITVHVPTVVSSQLLAKLELTLVAYKTPGALFRTVVMSLASQKCVAVRVRG